MASDGTGAHTAVAGVCHVTMAVAALGRMMAEARFRRWHASTRIIRPGRVRIKRTAQLNVRYRGQPGHYLLMAGFTGFDPRQSSGRIRGTGVTEPWSGWL